MIEIRLLDKIIQSWGKAVMPLYKNNSNDIIVLFINNMNIKELKQTWVDNPRFQLRLDPLQRPDIVLEIDWIA